MRLNLKPGYVPPIYGTILLSDVYSTIFRRVKCPYHIQQHPKMESLSNIFGTPQSELSLKVVSFLLQVPFTGTKALATRTFLSMDREQKSNMRHPR